MGDLKISPLAPKVSPQLPALNGVRMATAQAGIKYKDRTDLLVMVFDQPTSVAGVFTKSKCSSAPVDWCRKALAGGKPARALVVNAGNANAFTGARGDEATAITAKAMADACGCAEDEVYLASTGVIGEPLDADQFAPLLSGLVADSKGDCWQQAAEAIMTTDTYPKLATSTFDLAGRSVTISGIAKGSGMIAPVIPTRV
jgi:glutamate N-acetyltransferase/amino-acid N-acetyltransferase